jgi:hypothetical protein
VRSRLAVYEKIPDDKAVKAQLLKSEAIQNDIWSQCVAASKASGSPAVMSLVLATVNEMIDITTVRTAALISHPPFGIFIMLMLTVLVSSLVAGYGMSISGYLSTFHFVLFMILVGVTVYVILDFEYPRIGLIRLDYMDALLIETLEQMK